MLTLVAAAFLYYRHQVGAICGDGWVSQSSGQGTCSNHQAIAERLYERTLLGIDHEHWLNVPRWVSGSIGLVNLAAAGALFWWRLASGASLDGTESQTAILLASGSNKHELHITVGPSPAGRIVTVTHSSGASATAPFFFDHDPDRGGPTLAALLATPNRRLGRRGRPAIEVYGARLFNALLPEPLQGSYRSARAKALQADARLRIVLNLDGKTADLPWEYLYDSERASFIAMSNDTSLLRTLIDSAATRPSQPVDQLHVLVMTCSPAGLEPIDTASEMNRIEKQLAPHGNRVQVRPVHGETFEDLRLALDDFAPHVFHFVGHGHWDASVDDGALAFCNNHGAHEPVTGRELGVLLNRPGLRLALLNSCDGARTSQQDRFAGVATSLVAQGVPAVIGMQYQIDDRAAAAFGSEFLAALVDTRSVDAALTTARVAVYTSRNATEWGAPVLTTRVPVDDVFSWSD